MSLLALLSQPVDQAPDVSARLGVQGILAKPFRPDRLVHELRSLFGEGWVPNAGPAVAAPAGMGLSPDDAANREPAVGCRAGDCAPALVRRGTQTHAFPPPS